MVNIPLPACCSNVIPFEDLAIEAFDPAESPTRIKFVSMDALCATDRLSLINLPKIESGNVIVGALFTAVNTGRPFSLSSKIYPIPETGPPLPIPPDVSINKLSPSISSRTAVTLVADGVPIILLILKTCPLKLLVAYIPTATLSPSYCAFVVLFII